LHHRHRLCAYAQPRFDGAVGGAFSAAGMHHLAPQQVDNGNQFHDARIRL
jgi:hypothetical protein